MKKLKITKKGGQILNDPPSMLKNEILKIFQTPNESLEEKIDAGIVYLAILATCNKKGEVFLDNNGKVLGEFVNKNYRILKNTLKKILIDLGLLFDDYGKPIN